MFYSILVLVDLTNERSHLSHPLEHNVKLLNATGSESLTELLDGLILLYYVGIHKSYVKVSNTVITRIVRRSARKLSGLLLLKHNEKCF